MPMMLALLTLAQITPVQPIVKGTALPPPGTEEAAVMAPLQRWFAGIDALDAAAIRDQIRIDGGGGATVAAVKADGTRTVKHITWEAYLANIKPGEHHYHEQFTGSPAIEIDGDIAMVWGDFVLSVDGKPATCGVDHFDMVRENGAWKVQNVTWSQRTTNAGAELIQSLLIANRGEIACRIIRTARAMGVRTVAVYSHADANALHVREADEAVHIGPSAARESYLVGEKIIAAAKQTGAEAVHPGYGFLSENADFAQAVIDAGIVWVGPKPDSIRAMGLKDAAKERMIAAGVPVTPGYLGEDQRPEHLKAEADKIGYPVLIKAVAGGGGKGMRRVDAPAEFADALLSCQREAASSFGNTQVLIEKYILSPRHIEVQVFGDSHGNAVHLFERDCSLQRRHQKVIEEAPAPGMDAATREAICAAAVRAARAVDYVGAGTIEFIADASEGLRADRIWFMEMNTRLQVEHPVTEEITGQDLVEWQLRVASGETLPKTQNEIAINGWAMEARLYAEDPVTGFLPSTGTLEVADFPHFARIETGVEQDDAISPFYDPMIAKVIATGDDREEAIDGLAEALRSVRVWPVKTNAAFLLACLAAPEFRAGDVTTGFIGNEGEALTAAPAATDAEWMVAAVQLFAPYFHHTDDKAADPWRNRLGFRLNAADRDEITVEHHGERRRIDLPSFDGSGFVLPVEGGALTWRDGQPLFFSPPRFGGATGAAAGVGAILSPMPGRIIAVEVAAGDTVTKGQKLVTLEAMKMEHSLTAPFDGVVAELNAEAGGQVSEGKLLVRVEKAA